MSLVVRINPQELLKAQEVVAFQGKHGRISPGSDRSKWPKSIGDVPLEIFVSQGTLSLGATDMPPPKLAWKIAKELTPQKSSDKVFNSGTPFLPIFDLSHSDSVFTKPYVAKVMVEEARIPKEVAFVATLTTSLRSATFALEGNVNSIMKGQKEVLVTDEAQLEEVRKMSFELETCKVSLEMRSRGLGWGSGN
ncbi:hypothetical protein NE237_006837 [Protea cynaroides]|uniref:Uncharacterized protein n=1 Tax=Protea cynaroides TaxID=273540 RepID=A0A9Q0QVP3_9MAGN|nr:hypothetical protein NE237_006837 [Protea cynaroides]